MRLFFKKIFSKTTLNFLFCICCILYLCFFPNFIFNAENYSRNINKYLLKNNGEKVVIDIWHIESFEGGKKSRKRYLEEIGIKFNKINPNIYVSVINLSEEQLYLNIQNGILPDVFSFSIGSGSLLTSYLKDLPKNKNIRDNLQNYGMVNNEILAYPYMLSCYVAISKNLNEAGLTNKLNAKVEKNKFGYGFSTKTNINPAKVLIENNISNLDKNKFFDDVSTYSSYSNFICGKFNTLVGTMRDYYRCKNREDLGKISNCYYELLENFSDLIQYIGINKNIKESKINCCKQFLNFLLEDYSQNKIKDYGLFCTTNLKIYENTEFELIEDKIFNNLKSINAFTKISDIESQKQDSLNILFS